MAAEKVQNSTFTATSVGGLTTIVVWAVETWGGKDLITPEVAAAFTAILMALFTHFVPDAK
ncbi:MAG TPA: hypothetical protein VGX03_26310 [Candidatus Binatia bacterium]|nr:hypothetical protein [Candidatus Binatia bacterium]